MGDVGCISILHWWIGQVLVFLNKLKVETIAQLFGEREKMGDTALKEAECLLSE